MSDPNPLWHTRAAAEAARRLDADPQQGLDPAQVRARLEQYGENRLAEKPPRARCLRSSTSSRAC